MLLLSVRISPISLISVLIKLMDIIGNGINAVTGGYISETSFEKLAQMIKGEKPDEEELQQLKNVNQRKTEGFLGPIQGVDPLKLEETGWGVLFAENTPIEVKEALRPLLEYRKEQAGDYYKESTVSPGESAKDFLAVYDAIVSAAVNPEKMPYYLLLVGDPESISYQFQYDLDLQYAVGRICFDTPEEYARYAQSVIKSEKNGSFLPRQATFFGVNNPDDRATKLSLTELINPITGKLPERYAKVAKDQPEWTIKTILEAEATKSQLAQILSGSDTSSLLFTASHGMGFPYGYNDELQRRHQGALLCQDWPGHLNWPNKLIPEEYYFSADDVASDTKLLGLIAFFFACYGAGTPYENDFVHCTAQSCRPPASKTPQS